MGIIHFLLRIKKLWQPRPASISLDRAILDSKRQLLEIFDCIQDPILIVSRDFRILRLNRAMLSLLGQKFAAYNDVIGLECFKVLHGRSSACDHCPVGNMFESTSVVQNPNLVEFVIGDAKMTFDVTVFPLRNNAGRIYAAVKYFRDVTQTIRLQAELYEKERSQVLGSLAVGLAHEIRNPLAVVSSTAQYVRSEFPGNGEVIENMELIIRNADQANSVLNDLLNFARPKETIQELVNIPEMLDEGIKLTRGQLGKQKIRVMKKVEDGLPAILANRHNFIQAYVNVLLSAADRMPHGGTIHVDAALEKDGRAISLMVKDTGHDLSPEVVSRIFKPFFRSRDGGGGLKLPVAEDIIRSHGGEMTFQSEEGAGSTVVMSLPLLEFTGVVKN